MLNKETVREMLDRLGKAVSRGDLKQVSASYVFPAMFLLEEQCTVFNKPGDVENVFGKGRNWYVEQGIVETKAEILKLNIMSDTIATVDVRWPGFDRDGKEVYTETSHYVIQLSEGKPLIRVAYSRTK